MLERAEAIFQFLAKTTEIYNPDQLPKSSFQKVGISPKDIDQWLELILFIQQMPRLRVIKKDSRTYVGTFENKFLTYLKGRFLDPDLDYMERSSAMLTYLKVMINVEKAKGEGIDWKALIADPWDISRPTIVRLVGEGQKMMEGTL